ncbi:hypothetical protein F5Y10DRAFT_219056 [Nemania abortiva]|nr:hypothetical protein F5Y10DRAFT_219056 [Nemania abortiva]
MVPASQGHLSPSICDRAVGNLSEGHQRNVNENSIIFLGFAAENGYGYSELQLYKQGLLSSSPEGSRDFTLDDPPGLISAREEIINRKNDIVYFDHDTMERLELFQTGPLQQIADVKTVAVHWRSFCTGGELKESLTAVYSRLRNVDTIVIVVDHRGRRSSDNTSYYTLPLGIHDMPNETLLEYEQQIVNWCTIGQRIQQMIRNSAFWEECNGSYALEQIPPIRINPPRIPQIYLMRFSRGGDQEGDLDLPPQVPSLARSLAPEPADLDELWNPKPPTDPVFTDYSLRNLLD